MKKGLALFILSVILWVACLFWLATAARKELDMIKQDGLKKIFEQIWEGKK